MPKWVERFINALFGPAGESVMEAEQRERNESVRRDVSAWHGARGLQARTRWSEQNHDGRDL